MTKKRTTKFGKEFEEKLNEKISETLEKRGYSFSTEEELLKFAEEHCTMTDDRKAKEMLYYVKGELFLKYNYKPSFVVNEETKGIDLTVEVIQYY